MHSESPAQFFALLDPQYFESLDRYKPADDYIHLVEEELDKSWRIRQGGFWTVCSPSDPATVPHGWKIHLSSQVSLGEETLRRLLPLLLEESVEFKFCSDRRMLALSLNKNWPRTGAGKFLTVYPRDLDSFKRIVRRCAEETKDLDGPHILSDRRYRDSRVVHYRYGEHWSSYEVGPNGERAPIVVGPEGERWSDERQAYYRFPPWTRDPFPDPPLTEQPGEAGILLQNRYRVTNAERFSSLGGIYLATDMETGRKVVVREARPHLGGEGQSIAILRKEARILKRMAATGYFAQFVDLFQEWEHWFLVQEHLEAESLWGYAINFTMGLENGQRTAAELFDRIRSTIIKIAEALIVVHERELVLRDLTRSNVMFTADTDEVRFIDLELAYELDGDEPMHPGWTAGYASKQQLHGETPTPAEDIYALGALVLDMITFTASGLPINRRGLMHGLRLALSDFGLPPVLYEVVDGLTTTEPKQRWPLKKVVEVLSSAEVSCNKIVIDETQARLPERGAPSPRLVGRVQDTMDRTARFCEGSAEYERDDRLFPASGAVFYTNPVSAQFGAAGTCYFLWRSRSQAPHRALEWTVTHLGHRPLPPGLMMGAGGVAWVLGDLGRGDVADQLLDHAADSPIAYQVPGMYYGAAGWGMANVAGWWRTQEDRFVDRAVQVGDWFLETASEDDEGIWWEEDGIIPLGYGHGGSGVAAFLHHLYAAVGDSRYLTAAGRALDFEWSERESLNSSVIWFAHKGASVSSPRSPHVRHGSAGIGAAMLRHHILTRDSEFARRAKLCARSVTSRHTNKPWHDYGLAGYGQLLLDMREYGLGEVYRDNAYYLAEALLCHGMERDEGIAFPGDDLLRISCDFGMGSAGIGLFLYRLANPGTTRFLWIDDLIRQRARADAPVQSARVAEAVT